MLTSRNTVEKRDFIRMSITCPVSYQSVDSHNVNTGTCVNLSAKGIMFQCDHKISIGSLLKINVSPKLNISPPFTAILKVLRVFPVPDNDGFFLAGSFEEVH